jgi:hypothetical protein
MKAKRFGDRPKVSTQSICLIIIFGILPNLSLFLGELYHIPSRFTLPLIIIFLWIAGAMSLWHFGKRRF